MATIIRHCPKLLHPFNALVCAATQSGKTTWIYNLLMSRHIEPFPQRIYWIYSYYCTPLFDELRASLPHIEFVKGLPKGVSEEEFAPPDALIIIDDMIEDVNRDILSLFVKGSHHLRRSCILVLQNMYHSNPHMRTISLNSHYIVLFKQPRDMMQIMCLGKQMYPHASRGFLQAYKSATDRPYGYLLLDLKGTTRDCLRLRSGCLGEMSDKMERTHDVDKGGALFVLIVEKELKELRRQAAEGRKEAKEKDLRETKVRRVEPKVNRKKRMISI